MSGRTFTRGDVVSFESGDMERVRGRVAQLLGDTPVLVIQPLDETLLEVQRLPHLVSLVQRWQPPRAICKHCGLTLTRYRDEWGQPDTSEYAWGTVKRGVSGYDTECRPAPDSDQDRPLPHEPVKVIEQPLPDW